MIVHYYDAHDFDPRLPTLHFSVMEGVQSCGMRCVPDPGGDGYHRGIFDGRPQTETVEESIAWVLMRWRSHWHGRRFADVVNAWPLRVVDPTLPGQEWRRTVVECERALWLARAADLEREAAEIRERLSTMEAP